MGIVYSLLLARLNELNISYFGIQKEFGEQPIAVHCSLYINVHCRKSCLYLPWQYPHCPSLS
jgi:hypothetical protein